MNEGHEQKNHTKIQIANKHINMDFNLIKNKKCKRKQDNNNRHYGRFLKI